MINIIVATANNGVIGKDGTLPWRLPADLAHFKDVTMGHPIIMGRNTYESIGRPLPGRTNIVITRNPDFAAEGCVIAGSLDEAFKKAEISEGSDEIFIIGGELVYIAALPLAQRIFLTKINADIAGDKFFKFDRTEWQQKSAEHHKADELNPYNYEFAVLEK